MFLRADGYLFTPFILAIDKKGGFGAISWHNSTMENYYVLYNIQDRKACELQGDEDFENIESSNSFRWSEITPFDTEILNSIWPIVLNKYKESLLNWMVDPITVESITNALDK